MERDGVEPSKTVGQQIYSLPRLTTSLPLLGARLRGQFDALDLNQTGRRTERPVPCYPPIGGDVSFCLAKTCFFVKQNTRLTPRVFTVFLEHGNKLSSFGIDKEQDAFLSPINALAMMDGHGLC